jgi:hypothetical protein
MIKAISDYLTGKTANTAEWRGNFGGPGRDAAEWTAMMIGCLILRLLTLKGRKLEPGKTFTVDQDIEFTLTKNAKEDPIMAPLAGRRFRVKMTAVVEPF